MNRPPLLPWSKETFSTRWSAQGRLSSTPIPRTPFLLLKAPVSTLYEEKFGGDRNMFTVGMYCTRMMARSKRIGLVVDCTALDLTEFEPLPVTKRSTTAAASSRTSVAAARRNGSNSNNNNNGAAKDPRVRYFHNPSEWDDFDVEYHRMVPPPVDNNNSNNASTGNAEPVAPKVLNDFFQVISNFQKSASSNNNDTTTTTTTHIALFDSRGGLGAAAYLAAAYMCHTLRAPVHAAIEAVKEGTPPQPSPENDVKWGLCDVRLVKDLQSRFMGRKEIVMEGRVPTWWWALDEEEDDEDEDGDGDGESTSKDGKKKRTREESIIIPPHESGAAISNGTKRPRIDNGSVGNGNNSLYPRVPTDALEPIPHGSPKYIRATTVLTQLTQATTPQPTDSNPNVLPLKPEVDLSNNNSTDNATIQSIKSNPNGFKVTWLSKGRRGLLLILSEAVFFVEQQQSSSIHVSQVTTMRFPTPQDGKKSQHRTLLDVVLVTDIEKGFQTHRFYALDILCIEGGRVWHKPWEQRWKFLNEGVVLPRKKEEGKQRQQQQSPQQQHGHIYAKEPIKLRAKEYFPMSKLAFVMKDVCAGVAHDADGVRVVSMGEYGIGGKKDSGSMAVVWRRGGNVGDEKLVSLLC